MQGYSVGCGLVVEVPRGELLAEGTYSFVVSQEVGNEEFGGIKFLLVK